MKMAFKELPLEAQARIGLRWSKDAAKAGTDAARIAASDASERGARLAAKFGAQRGAAMASEMAAKQAAAAEAGPIGALYDAVTVVGMTLDLLDVGNYMNMTQTSDFLKTKQQFDVSFQNINLVPRGNPPVVGNFPNFFGPLDSVQETMEITDYLALETSNANAIIMSSQGADIKKRVLDQIKIGKDDMPALTGTITDVQFLNLYPAYISDDDSTALANMTLQKMCTDKGGAVFTPGPNIDPVCSYPTKESCHGSSQWPPPNDDSVNYTYTEWRYSNYFDQFKNGDGSNTYTGVPSGGACTVQSDALHQLCDKSETTVAGTAANTYKRDTGECVNSSAYCKIKGVSYTNSMDPSRMGGLGSGPLPSCFVGDKQEILENIIGSGTIYRFFSSGGDMAAAQQIATHIAPISASSVGSGNSTVDTTLASVANGSIVATNALTGALSQFAQAEVQAGHVVLNSGYQALVNPVVDVISGNSGNIGTTAATLAGNTAQAAQDLGNSHNAAEAFGHMTELAATATATAVALVTAPAHAWAAGVSGELQTALTGDPTQSVTHVLQEANSIANTANSIDNAAAHGDVEGVLAGTLSTATQSLALYASAMAAPLTAIGSGAVSSFSTVGSGDPNAAFNNIEHQANAMNSMAHNIDNAIDSGNGGAAVVDIANLAAQSAAIVAAAVTAPIAAAAAVAVDYVANVANNPTHAVDTATNDVVDSANQVDRAIDSGNSNQAAAAVVNVVGDSLNLATTSTVAGLAIGVTAVVDFFSQVAATGQHGCIPKYDNFRYPCSKGYYGTCKLPYGCPGLPTSCDGVSNPQDCSCPGGTVDSSGKCNKPAWAQSCNVGWDEILGKTSLHDYCWSDAQNAPKRINACCAADAKWLTWAKASACPNSADGQGCTFTDTTNIVQSCPIGRYVM